MLSTATRNYGARVCAYCLGPAQGNYAIHRDGEGDGPEVDLCDAHGGFPTPTLGEIWARIRVRAGLVSS